MRRMPSDPLGTERSSASVPQGQPHVHDPHKPSITLVLPAYNEAARIGSALDELFGYLHRGGRPREGGRSATDMGPVEVLVVDDGSTDATVDIVTMRQEINGGEHLALRLLKRPHAGKGAAVRAGMLDAQGDYVIFADAD